MSRIGKLPIKLPKGVTVDLTANNLVKVKGPLGELAQKIDPDLKIIIDNDILRIERPSEQKRHKAMHGLYRSLVANMVKGVSEGFKTVQELVGVGYKVNATGQQIEFSLGHSHSIILVVPDIIKVQTLTERGKNPTLIMTSIDKQLLGQVAAKVRSLKKPEPYKGKGIKFMGEVLRRKAGKAAASAGK